MPKIRIFSTPSCPYCVTLKEYLKDHNMEFEDFNVGENKEAREEMIKKSKQMGVPVIEIDNKIIVGFDKAKINSLLNIKD
ncbi:MAG: glutaredoxin domain-containing protein [Candidatus Nealsonbacteria bacterium]